MAMFWRFLEVGATVFDDGADTGQVLDLPLFGRIRTLLSVFVTGVTASPG